MGDSVELRCHPWRDCGDMGDAGRGGIVVSGGGSRRRELALNPRFPGVQSGVTSPKSIPHPGCALQLGLLRASVALHCKQKCED